MAKPFVAVLMGSDSDLPVVQSAIDVLKTQSRSHRRTVRQQQPMRM